MVASVLPAKFCIESCKTFELPQLFLVFVFVLLASLVSTMPPSMKRPAAVVEAPEPEPAMKKPAAAKAASAKAIAEETKPADEMKPRPECVAELKKIEDDPKIKPLDKKLARFRACADPNADGSELFQLLKKFFEPGEMSALWGRFGTLVNGQSPETQQAWQKICSMDWRSGKQEAKGKILAMQVVNPSKWKEFLVHESNTLTRKVTKEVKKKRYYRGELVQLHGQEEFDDFVSKGKFEVGEDSDGDECFYKKEKAEIDSLEMARVAKTQKTRSNASGGEVDALNSAFKAEFQGKGGPKELTDGTKKSNKNKNKPEPKEETPADKCLKACNTALKAVVRHQGQLLVAISQLEKIKMATGIRQSCAACLNVNKKIHAQLQVLVADFKMTPAANALLDKVEKHCAESTDLQKKAKPFLKETK